jgi:hypothetical protein
VTLWSRAVIRIGAGVSLSIFVYVGCLTKMNMLCRLFTHVPYE